MLKLELLFLCILIMSLLMKNFMIHTSMILNFMTLIMCMMFINNNSYTFMCSSYATDMMSSSLIILSMWVMSMMIIASTKINIFNMKSKLFIFNIMLLLFILIHCFSTPCMFYFYIWFEASLIPTMILIMVWGYQQERSQASLYLMIYTVTASLPMLFMICKIYFYSMTSFMPMFMMIKFMIKYSTPFIAWIMIVGGFMVKLPMFLVHLWLPKAHVEAPVSGSMILAAILLKLGGYGNLRMFSIIQYLPKMLFYLISSISLIGAIVTSMICLRQPDLKALIAYSSVSHMGLMITGAISSLRWGSYAALAMMIAHALSSSAMFVLSNMNYEITKTRSIFLNKGMLSILPIISMWWFLITSSNMAAPPSINLMSEIMLITSIMSMSFLSIMPLMLTSFFTVCYSLYLYTAINHGKTLIIMNPMSNIKQKDFLLLMMHIMPIIFLILKPTLIMNWN